MAACDEACTGCMGGGPARCRKCAAGYRSSGMKCLGGFYWTLKNDCIPPGMVMLDKPLSLQPFHLQYLQTYIFLYWIQKQDNVLEPLTIFHISVKNIFILLSNGAILCLSLITRIHIWSLEYTYIKKQWYSNANIYATCLQNFFFYRNVIL